MTTKQKSMKAPLSLISSFQLASARINLSQINQIKCLAPRSTRNLSRKLVFYIVVFGSRPYRLGTLKAAWSKKDRYQTQRPKVKAVDHELMVKNKYLRRRIRLSIRMVVIRSHLFRQVFTACKSSSLSPSSFIITRSDKRAVGHCNFQHFSFSCRSYRANTLRPASSKISDS